MLKSYGGYVWSNQDPASTNPDWIKLAGFPALAIGATGLVYAGTRTQPNGYRPVDYVSAAARLGGNLFPLQLANTFRVPEVLSPFTSAKYKSKVSPKWNIWTKEQLSSESTYEWLKYSTGLSDDQLRAKGITKGMVGNDLATSITWTQTGVSRGTLTAKFANSIDQVLSTDIALVAANYENESLLTNQRGLNKIVQGMFAAADMWGKHNWNPEDVLSTRARFDQGQIVEQAIKPKYIFMPSPEGNIQDVGDLLRRTNYVRGIAAFEMNRFNTLLDQVTEQFFGDTGQKFFRNVLGLGPSINPGPATRMFAKYGLLAAGAGGLVIGQQSIDWFRRQGGLPTHLTASAITAAGVSHVASRVGMTSKNSFLLGLSAFAAQQILPNFNDGIIEGIATLGVNASLVRANPLNPFSYYRRTMEGFLPGSTDWQTGALVAGAAMMAAGVRMPLMKENLNVAIARQLGKPNITDIAMANKSVKDLFFEKVAIELGMTPDDSHGFFHRKEMLALYHDRALPTEAYVERTRKLNEFWVQAEDFHTSFAKTNPLNNELMIELESIKKSHSGSGWIDNLMMQSKGFLAEAKASFWGADLRANPEVLQAARDLGFSGFTPVGRLGRLGAVGLVAFGLHGLLTGGLLGSMEDSRELRDIYSGKQLVEIKRSRFWEAGGTPFEGGETNYFRPHAYALMMNRVRQKGVWGEDEDKISPIGKWLRKNFTYELERQNYYDRPYPVSSAAFSDVPIIGKVLGATIGQIIKPAKLMHTDEWIRNSEQGNPEFASVFKGNFIEPAYNLGAVGTGRPISPYSLPSVGSDLVSQFRELEGMTGWAKEVMFGRIFGNENWATDQARLATSGEMTSWTNQFWEMQMGGAFFSNEVLRRVFHKSASEIKKYNPITNSMPAWMPDKFHYGDPYRLVEWGEARMPGVGYAALHPELKGVDPEAYPLIYKYQILSDVAPLTPEFFKIQKQVFAARSAGSFSKKEEEFLDKVDQNHKKVVDKFTANTMDPNAIRLPGSGLTSSISQSLRQLTLDVVAPAEYMVPMGFRPFQKLLGGGRDAIQQYEYDRLYGTPMAFWDKPLRDWFRPAMYSTMHMLGYEGKPLWREQADQTNEYFDKLEFLKYTNLASAAMEKGDGRAAAQFKWMASQTRYGVNPQGSPLSIYWSLPAEERKFFAAFAGATENSERKRILEMVPQDHAHLYQALWSRMDSGDPNLFNTSSQIDTAYMRERYQQIGEFARRAPSPDWIGWHEDVDMSDVQIRYLNHLGKEIHDYGMWESDVRKSEAQPFLEGVEDAIMESGSVPFASVRAEMYNMVGSSMNPPHMSVNFLPGEQPLLSLRHNDNRDQEIRSKLQGYINGY